jgi:CheY-specific phosphatase CheX
LGLEQSEYITDDITVILALVVQWKEPSITECRKKTAILFGSKMIGENITSFDSLAQSGIAELGNVYHGSVPA